MGSGTQIKPPPTAAYGRVTQHSGDARNDQLSRVGTRAAAGLLCPVAPGVGRATAARAAGRAGAPARPARDRPHHHRSRDLWLLTLTRSLWHAAAHSRSRADTRTASGGRARHLLRPAGHL